MSVHTTIILVKTPVCRQRIQNKYIAMADIPAEDGCDIITTLDVDMQDICEKALVDKLMK